MLDVVTVPASLNGLRMPLMAQSVALAIGAAAILALLVVAGRQVRRYGTWVPVLCLLGGFCTVALEPIVGVLGHGTHPVIGQIPLLQTLGRSIPLHIGLVYTFYYGSMYILLFPRLMTTGLTRSQTWQLFWATVVGAFVFEAIPLQIGLWVYYEPQALWFWRGGMPGFWVVANAVSVLVPLALIKVLLPRCTGWRQWLVVPLSPMGALMGHVGTGFPFYIAGNAGASPWLVELSGVASLGLALWAVSECATLLSSPVSRPAGVAAAGAHAGIQPHA